MRLIDADALKNDLTRFYEGEVVARQLIDDQPTIDQSAQPERKKGRWEHDGHHIRCNKCGVYMCDTDREGDRIATNYCPNCGALMEDGQDGSI